MVITDYKVIVEKEVSAQALTTSTSLSFWGGVDPATGRIQDIHNSLNGENLTGKVLCIPYDRGSCSSSGVMLEMIRRGTNPVAILCIEAEAVLALGPIIGEKMYGRTIAMRTVSEELFYRISNGSIITFTEDTIVVEK
ncbi:MAG: DUF126 domain-containing protein [Lachnospiraceae bacterium]